MGKTTSWSSIFKSLASDWLYVSSAIARHGEASPTPAFYKYGVMAFHHHKLQNVVDE